MLRKVGIGLIVAAAVVVLGTLQAKEPESHPLKDFFKQNGVMIALPILKTDVTAEGLGLTEEQKKEIAPLQKEMMESFMKAAKEGTNAPADMRKQMEGMSAEYAKKVETILKPEQLDRLLEIVTQMVGPAVLFQQSDLDKKFELTDEQKEKIKSINKDTQAKLGKEMANIKPPMPSGNPPDMQQMREKMKEMRKEQMKKMRPFLKEANDNIEKVLTPKQREMLSKMKGKEIDVDKLFEEMADKAEMPGM